MKAHNTLIAEIGDTVELTSNTMKFGEKIVSGAKFVDGMGIDGADSSVLKEIIHLSEDGLVVVAVGIDELTVKLNSLEIVSKGLSLSGQALEELKSNIVHTLDKIDLRTLRDEDELKGIIRRSIKNYLFKATKKNPLILPVVMVM